MNKFGIVVASGREKGGDKKGESRVGVLSALVIFSFLSWEAVHG